MNNTPTPKLTVYENRGGEVWERQPDGRRELFAEDIIRKLTTQELELTAAREELVETRKDFMCLAELLDGHDATECRMNLVRLKEQLDRLAEAIRKHKTTLRFAPDFCDVELYEALQSLNPDHTVDANDMIADVKGGSDDFDQFRPFDF
jgi:hypothetical protein